MTDFKRHLKIYEEELKALVDSLYDICKREKMNLIMGIQLGARSIQVTSTISPDTALHNLMGAHCMLDEGTLPKPILQYLLEAREDDVDIQVFDSFQDLEAAVDNADLNKKH